jgi:hypothetical protein
MTLQTTNTSVLPPPGLVDFDTLGGGEERWSVVFVLGGSLAVETRRNFLSEVHLAASIVDVQNQTWLTAGIHGAMDAALAAAVDSVQSALKAAGSDVPILEVRLISHRDAESRIQMDQTPRFYNLTECARVLGVSRQRATALLDDRKLPVADAQSGDRLLWNASKFDRFAADRRVRVSNTPNGWDPDAMA